MGSFRGFWRNLEIQDGGPIWPTFRNHDVIPASCDVINSWCGPQRKQFQRYYIPSKSHCCSIYILRVRWGGGGFRSPRPRSRRSKKSPLWIGLKYGNLSMGEILVVTSAQARPYRPWGRGRGEFLWSYFMPKWLRDRFSSDFQRNNFWSSERNHIVSTLEIKS